MSGVRFDDRALPPGAELVTPFGRRRVTHAFHDIDGTHSLIRDWVPVMTLVLGAVAGHGPPPASAGDAEMAEALWARRGGDFGEAGRFAVESAGLSALAQMEWALRRALAAGRLRLEGFAPEANTRALEALWRGDEEFSDVAESPALRARLAEMASRLFRAYERLLLRMNRDRNLADARVHPAAWRVPGSLAFLRALRAAGVRNYFVTGAVVEENADGRPAGTMAEEIAALGYEVGPGALVERLCGSTWREKLPKRRLMETLCRAEGVDPARLLVVGDGRSEIAAGRGLGALTLSRLPADARRAREIHRALGTHVVVEHYSAWPGLTAG